MNLHHTESDIEQIETMQKMDIIPQIATGALSGLVATTYMAVEQALGPQTSLAVKRHIMLDVVLLLCVMACEKLQTSGDEMGKRISHAFDLATRGEN
jgi:hypothetical protein